MPRGKKGTGPHSKYSPNQHAAATHKVAAAPSLDEPPRWVHEKPLGSIDIATLSGESLKVYARRAGVLPRDVDGLTEDRLRQNTRLMIQNHFELIDEGL